MKKVISLLLALTLVLAIAPMAFAETAAEEVFVNDFDSVDDTLTVTAAGAAGIDTTNMWLRLWPNIGNTGTNANETAHHNNATGPSSMSTDATYNDQTVVWDFDLMRHQDSTDRIVPRYTDSARYSFGPGIDIRPNGSVVAFSVSGGDKVIGHVEAGEWTNIKLKYAISSTGNQRIDYYINYKHVATLYNADTVCRSGMTQLAFYHQSYTSEMGAALNATRTDSRPESTYIKNAKLTVNPTDATIAAIEALAVSDVEYVDGNTLIINFNKAYSALPLTEDVMVTDSAAAPVVATSVSAVDSDSIKVTFESKVYVGSTYDYDILAGDDEAMGSFTVYFNDTFDYFTEGTPTQAASAGVASKQWGTAADRYGDASSKSFVWSTSQLNGVSGDPALITKDSSQIVWASYGESTPVTNKTIVVSMDFQRGSERIGGHLLSFTSVWYRNPLFNVTVAADGTVTANLTTVGTALPGEWHNLTVHALTSNQGEVYDVYFDGVLMADNIVGTDKRGFSAIKTIMTASAPADSAVTELDNRNAGRYDVLVVDNFYLGTNLNYVTSEVKKSFDGTDASVYMGYKTDAVAVSALYDAAGAIKDVKLSAIEGNVGDNVSWTGAGTFDSAVAGDTVKFMVVDSLLNLKPLVNYATATVAATE